MHKSIFTMVSNFYKDDLYGIKINYLSITQYLNDKQILSSYYPKYKDTIVQYDDICERVHS